MLKNLVILSALTLSAPTFAAIQTWDWNSSNNPLSSGNDGNTISGVSGGISLTVSAWSDTGGSNDDQVESAELVYYQSGNNLGAINRDEVDDSPNHSIDNVTGPGEGYRDSDMVLLEFSREVNLTHVDIGWGTDDGGSGNDGRADMSVAAINSNNMSGNTWAQILSGGTSNSLSDIYTSNPDYQSISGFDGVFSKFWLVGAYNSAFGYLHDYYNDGIKLDGIKTSTIDITGGEVPAPGSLLLLLIGLLALYRYRNQDNTGMTAVRF